MDLRISQGLGALADNLVSRQETVAEHYYSISGFSGSLPVYLHSQLRHCFLWEAFSDFPDVD